jgi:hypothetical protein
MAISNAQVSIGTVATAIDGVWTNPSQIAIHNADNTQAVYIGGEGVTPLNGMIIEKLDTLQFTLNPLEQIYAVSTKLGHTISYLRQTI